MSLADALAHHQAGRWTEAEAAYRALGEDPVALGNLGALLNARQRSEEAVPLLRRAVALEPARAAHWSNLGVALGPGAEALSCFDTAARLEPDSAIHPYNRGRALAALGRSTEAEAACRAALARDPHHAGARYNLAMALLRQGQLAEGLAAMEARWGLPDFQPTPYPDLPWWGGEPLSGPLLLFADQGFGDTLMMARYLPYLRREGIEPVVCCEPPLHRVLATALPGLRLVAPGGPLPACAAKLALLSLPLRFGTTLDHLPATVPYLAVPPEVRARPVLDAALDALPPGPRIGLVWAGNPRHAQDRLRSLDPARLAPLADLPGVGWVSLQVGAPGLPSLPGLLDLGPHLKDFGDTAHALSRLDLLISVDTAPAHLAGALGLPTLLLLPYVPDWRWMEGRNDSPWYPTLQLVRQPSPGDWAAVVAQLVENLR
jgi:hypothetical protein